MEERKVFLIMLGYEWKSSPVVMCTGFSNVVDADTAMAAGIKALAIKPLTNKEMAAVIRKALDK